MIDRLEITIEPLSDELRNLTVYVPDKEGKRRKRYPVLYMMDGQNIFFDDEATYGKSWGMFDYLSEHHIPLIVVGIDSSRNPDNTRLCEYSPYSYNDFKFGKVKGKGKEMVEWIIDELKPYIDKKYPTKKDRHNTMIGGSSMGGLISYYALLKHNDVFSKAACLSPSLWVNNKKLVALAKKVKIDPDTAMYLDYGSEETKGSFGKMANSCFWNCIDILKTKPVSLNIRVIQGGTHTEASWEKQVPIFLNVLLKGD
ncbi:MAG: alpha/beta hydrolase-fold protein [Erysipelotrichaceae bacterium]|nr:alpha/beta hydrolase-fold protein [Erysipelotrichaceae bacterium]